MELATRAEVVFVGTVASADGHPLLGREERFTISVAHIYKGSLGSFVQVRTNPGSGACGVDFVLGATYVVFASERDGHLTTYTCSGTTTNLGVLSRAGFSAPLRSFDPSAPLDPKAIALTDNPGRAGPIAAAALLLVALLITYAMTAPDWKPQLRARSHRRG